ncbi:Uncharacterised protein [Yersinia nurmii]|uniref:Uncharacterized protein n=1 Tax=Yersinia nurmii TaxID=685706 RepID=A0ABM9SLZ9_9GAMM|nr:Uncharacterised protein [Yersinia nurmii]
MISMGGVIKIAPLYSFIHKVIHRVDRLDHVAIAHENHTRKASKIRLLLPAMAFLVPDSAIEDEDTLWHKSQKTP